MAAQQQRCTWCGEPLPAQAHVCDLNLETRTELALDAVSGPVDRTPLGTHGRGTVMRGIVVTPLGLTMLSPHVKARLGLP